MKKILTLAMLFACLLPGASTTPAFEVASITPCPPGTSAPPTEHAGTATVQWIFPGGRFEAKATNVKFLLEWAFDIQPTQHSRGPAWTETDRFDIVAKAEAGSTEKEFKLMARTLLAERFGVKFHYEKRDQPVYVISLGKSAPKLFPSKDGEIHALQMSRQMNPGQTVATAHVVATRFTLAQLADTFARQLDRAMLNQTGLDGEYNFTLDLTPDESCPNVLDATILISALREQLGLALKADTISVDFMVIDSADKVGAGN